MPLRPKVETLPAEVKAWLDEALVESNFSGYRTLADELAARGYTIGKSSLQRYGEKFEQRIDQLKLATEQAKAIVAGSPDDEGAISEALLRLVQERLFTVLRDLEIDPSKPLNLNGAAKAIAELARATVTQKKWMTEVREKAKAAAEAVAEIARNGGITPQLEQTIRDRIMGIAA